MAAMPSVILVSKTGFEFSVTTVQGFVDAVYSRGALPKVGTVQDNYEALLGSGQTPVENPFESITLHDIKSPTSPAGIALRAAYASAPQVQQAQRLSTSTDLTTAGVLSAAAPFAPVSTLGPNDIVVDPRETFQEFMGCGAALTDSAAHVLMTYLTEAQRTALLTEMFSPEQANFTCVRIGLGATDFQQTPFYTYDEVGTAGQTDPNLVNFSIQRDTVRLIPLLRQILAINPGVRIFASVWFPPSWMLTDPTKGFTSTFTMSSAWLSTYATYLVKAVQAYQAHGVPIWALSPVNEPGPAGSKFAITPADQKTLIRSLGPKLEDAGLPTRLLAHDHGWDSIHGIDPTALLDDPATTRWIDGIAFHGYDVAPYKAGMDLRRFNPALPMYMTEFRSLLATSAANTMRQMAGGYVVESVEAFARTVIAWNLALDEAGNPSTTATGRRGVVTVPSNGSGAVVRNRDFWALSHLTRFAQRGALRCRVSSPRGDLYVDPTRLPQTIKRTALVNPDGTVVLYVFNGSAASVTLQVVDARTNRAFPATIPAGDLATFVWGTTAQNAPAGAPIVLTPPQVTVAAGAGPGTVTLTWPAPAPGAVVTGYSVLRDGVRVGQAPHGTTSFTEYVPAGTYSYRVVTEAVGGTATSAGAPVTVPAPAAPGAPGSVTVTPSAAGAGLVVSWAASAANGSDVGYTISRATSPGGATTVVGRVARGYTSYTNTSALPGTTYYYTVTATNAVGSTASAEVSGVQSGVLVDATSLGTPAGGTGHTLSWQHTIASGLTNRMVMVSVASAGTGTTTTNPRIDSVTYGGAVMTRVARAAGNPGQSNNRLVDVWYLVNPPVGASTVQAKVATTPTDDATGIFFPAAISFGGVDQTTPLRTPATATGASVSTLAASTTGGQPSDLVFATAAARTTTNPLTVGGAQTAKWQQNRGDNTQHLATVQPGSASSVSSSFGWSDGANVGAVVAVAVKSA